MRVLVPAALTGLMSMRLIGADLDLSIEIPRLSVAEYHRPYVAMWVESADHGVAGTLAVWYDLQTKKTDPGTTWLKDMRQWWRKTGRDLKMPVDGISGATRPPGTHPISFRGASTFLGKLQPGSYELVVEAAREVGGREVLRIPFQWPGSAAKSGKAQGQHELGSVSLTIKP